MKALEIADALVSHLSKYKTPSQERGLINGAIEELRRLAAVEAELERIKALEPVAWGLLHSKGLEFGSAYAPQKTKEAAEEMARQHMGDVTVTALYALGIET